MRIVVRRTLKVLALAALAMVLGLTGCTDTLTDYGDIDAELGAYHTEGKFRQAHLLERAVKGGTAGKSASNNEIGLIISVQSGVEKQRVIDRYRVANRFRVSNRFNYDYVFDGFAWVVDDTTGQNDYREFFDLLAADPDILWFEPDFDVDARPSQAVSGGAGQMIPWSVAAIGGMESAAQSGNGSGTVGVDIYVLDTGVSNNDINVTEDLDVREGMNDPADYDGHGTHIAGIAAAVDDSDGLVGIAPGANVHNLKVLNDDGKSDVSVVIAAVEHILAEKLANPSTPMVVNMSLGEDIGNASYTALDEAVVAATAEGVVFVVAAGNQGRNANHVTPAHVHEAITVGSYDMRGRFSSFSNYGPRVDLLAPGEDIVSLRPGTGNPVEMTGTSMATAHVTGAAALYLWQHPSASPAQVQAALLANAKDFVVNTRSNTTSKSVWVGEEAGATGMTYRDEFDAVSYSGNNGTASWAGSWQEIGESTNPNSGSVKVINNRKMCVDKRCLRVRGVRANRGISRALDLSSAVSATLTFKARRNGLSNASMTLEISSDGGATWTVLKTFADGHDAHPQPEQFDISAYLSADTQIKFHSYTAGRGSLNIDNVQVETNTVISGGQIVYDDDVRDLFGAVSYSGNDGSRAWSGAWQEIGETTNPVSGKVRVKSSSRCTGTCLRLDADADDRGAGRAVNLSGASSARLSFEWSRYNLNGNSVRVEVSGDGGTSWTTLMTIPTGPDGHPTSESFDISAYVSASTQIRFMLATGGSGGYFYIDDVRVEF